jgi:hypothetical protein
MQRSRTPSKLSESLHQRLNSYALAASAAGVSLLALVQSTEAKIVYTKAHHIIRPDSRYKIDLNNDGVADVVIVDKVDKFNCAPNCIGSIYATAGSFLGGRLDPAPLALRKGATIGASRKFWSSHGTMAQALFLSGGTLSSSGAWANVTNRCLGLRFTLNHQRHYGWARLSVTISDKTAKITATLNGYAYETIANKPIIAGKTHGKDVITVEPASLGHLARGASAIPAWRTKESR